MNAFRIYSRNGFEQSGAAHITVGRAHVILSRHGFSETIAVYVGADEKPRKIWAHVLPDTIREALALAESLSGFEAAPADSPSFGSPACVEDESGKCVHPNHRHSKENEREQKR